MPDKSDESKLEDEDLIESIAGDHHISLKGGDVECLCYVYALVCQECVRRLGGGNEGDDEDDDDGCELLNEASLKSMRTALETIHKKFFHFKAKKRIKDVDPKYRDIGDVIPKLVFIVPRLKAMAAIYDVARLDLLQSPEKLSMQIEASIKYDELLLECRGCIIEVYAHIKWWCDQPSANCQEQDLESTG